MKLTIPFYTLREGVDQYNWSEEYDMPDALMELEMSPLFATAFKVVNVRIRDTAPAETRERVLEFQQKLADKWKAIHTPAAVEQEVQALMSAVGIEATILAAMVPSRPDDEQT